MKKTLMVMMLAAGMMAVWAGGATAQMKFGVKAGTNVNKVSVDDLKHSLDAENRFGFFVGPTLDVSLPVPGLGVDVSLLYENRRVRLSDATFEDEQNFHLLSLPLNVRYAVGIGSIVNVYAATGPQFTYNVGDRQWDFDHRKELLEGWALSNAELSWNVGCGVTVLKHVRVGYNYNILLGTDEDGKHGFWLWDNAERYDDRAKYNTHQVSLTYFF